MPADETGRDEGAAVPGAGADRGQAAARGHGHGAADARAEAGGGAEAGAGGGAEAEAEAGAEAGAAAYTARVALFGFDDRVARLRMTYVPASKRAGRAGLFLGGGLAAAPLLALVPPHVPWLIGSIGAGLFFAGRAWRGEYLVHRVDAACPRCGERLRLEPGARVRFPMDIDCFGCHQAVMLDGLERAPVQSPDDDGPHDLAASLRTGDTGHTMIRTDLLEEVLETWGWARAALIDEAENVPAERFEFRPTPDVRSFADVVRHVLEFGEMMVGELTREDGDFRRQSFDAFMHEYATAMAGLASKVELLNALRGQHEAGERRFRERGEAFMLGRIHRFDGEQGTRLAWLVHGVEHESHHTGQLTVYTRLMGLVPALTQKIQASAS